MTIFPNSKISLPCNNYYSHNVHRPRFVIINVQALIEVWITWLEETYIVFSHCRIKYVHVERSWPIIRYVHNIIRDHLFFQVQSDDSRPARPCIVRYMSWYRHLDFYTIFYCKMLADPPLAKIEAEVCFVAVSNNYYSRSADFWFYF